MVLEEGQNQIYINLKKDLKELYEKAVLHPLISMSIIFAVLLLIIIPDNQRVTAAQIIGGLIGSVAKNLVILQN